MQSKRNTATRNITEQGFILVSVIWIAGLLAVMATAFTIGIRSYTLVGRNAILGERAEAIADGMALLWALRLSSFDVTGNPQVVSSKPSTCRWSSVATAIITIQDQGGLVDLNTASPPLLDKMLEDLGLSLSESQSFQAALRDFRDPDHIAETTGEEAEAYPGKGFGPKNAPFSIPEELHQIPGVTEEQRGRLLRLTTVFSQQTGIDPARAPEELRRVLGISDASNPDNIAFASPSPQRVFAIEAAVELGDGSRFVRRALIALLRQPERPFAILSWQHGTGTGQPLPSTAPLQPCLN